MSAQLVDSAQSIVTKSTANSFPGANAGTAQTIVVGQTVQLDGGGSIDIGGHGLTYSWSLLYAPPGSVAALSSISSPRPTFQADLAGTYIAQLIVNDCGMNSVSTVEIVTSDVAPLANAGPAELIGVGSVVDLSGDGSTVSGGNAISTYHWSLLNKPATSTATLSWPTSEFPFFVVDKVGKYIAQLVVNDGTLNSAPSTMRASTTGPLPPVANAGSNQTVAIGSTVNLTGVASSSPDGSPLGYVWVILSRPSTSHASVAGMNAADATFVADVAGLYIVQLSVHSAYGSGVPLTVEITAASNQAPVVSAGPNQTITLPTNQVTLLGTASDDGLPNGTLALSWTVVSGPGTVNFFNPNEAMTQTTFSVAGTYVLNLTANDSALSTNATTTITVNPSTFPPPVVSAGPNQTITLPANVVTLNGSATDGGLSLTTSWSVVSGAGPAAFANVNSAATTAMFTIAGVYDLRLTRS